MSPALFPRVLLVSFIAVFATCSKFQTPDAATNDTGTDAPAMDAAMPLTDAAVDLPVDATEGDAVGTDGPVDLAPVDLAPVDLAPVDLAPVDLAPIDLAPVALAPADLAPADAQADTGPSTCSAGVTHNCNGACVTNNSPDHCGGSCDPCTAPTGATATCTAGVCDFTCGTGKKCGGKCIAATDCCSSADCPAQAGGQTGQCDTSTNKCSYACPSNTTPCGGNCIPAGTCCTAADCKGTCQTCPGAGMMCKPVAGADDPDSCNGTCDATGTCKSKRGQACTTVAGGCVSGTMCAPDGYCCDRACTGSCEACDVGGSAGTCTAVSGSPHTGHNGCLGGGTACAGSCTGASNGACSYPTGSCGAASCTNATLTPAGTCGGGSCSVPAPHACTGGLVCASATACKASCTTANDCTVAGSYCTSAGMCAPKKALGGGCGNNTECTSGNCAPGGICCDAPCNGVCQQCNSAGHCAATSDDSACGTIACPADTACRDWATSITSNRCRALGQCKTASDCGFTNQPVDTRCGSSTVAKTCDGQGNCANPTVQCGPDPSCSIGPNVCCIDASSGSSSCTPDTGTDPCGGNFNGNIRCDETADCPGTQICCAYLSPFGRNVGCFDRSTGCPTSTSTFKTIQVCRPENVAECLPGTTCTAPTPGSYPPYYTCI
ncbi:MAG TPA: hypothetical protein VHU40_16160 [Polyangia bacterium]|nr:hypothetical protein [Polyangia bacterium]